MILFTAMESSPMPVVGNLTGCPAQWLDFCKRNPFQVGTIDPALPYLPDVDDITDETAKLIGRLNYVINTHPYKSDRAKYGIADKWGLDPSNDCEDKALVKRMLISHCTGIPLIRLSLALLTTRAAYRRPAMDHAVLCLRTSRGDYILDNLTNHIHPWEEVPAKRWIARHGAYLNWEFLR